jgi:hypothetical protein
LRVPEYEYNEGVKRATQTTNEGYETMTATIKVNRKMVTYNLTEMTVGSLLKASLIDRGFDGTCWNWAS